MAEEATTTNTKKIVAIVVGVILVIAAAVVAIILINNNKNNSNDQGSSKEVLNDDFFKTTDTKIVISNTSNSTDPTVAKKVHQVYTVDGDKVTGLKVYSEFESEQAAKDADAKPEVEEAMKTGNYKEHHVEGKFIIVTMSDSTYQSVTAEQLRMTAKAIEEVVQNGTDQQTQTQTETQSAESTTSSSATSDETEE
ncbi:hypothetical protein IKF27_00885 [Candidatus Saccharibacteria bacterium]|nr:hypothetical protein [Candidatus Saccharibacteria bacterium]